MWTPTVKPKLSQLGFQLVALGAMACEQSSEPQLAQGVARLTFRNVGAVTQLVNDDTRCGFASAAAFRSLTVQGEPGSLGTATWTVSGCVLDQGAGVSLGEDCLGVDTTVLGSVIVDATREVHGVLTGDPVTPVLPSSAESVVMKVNAKLEEFTALSSADDNLMTVTKGEVSFTARPRLARSASHGLCAVATPNVEFSDVAWKDADLHLNAESQQGPLAMPASMDATVSLSNLRAVAGRFGDDENELSGTLRINGKDVAIPVPDDRGLDPNYNARAYQNRYACTPDLALPVSFACDVPQEVLGHGVARLSVRTLGAVLAAAQADTTCGFSSSAALGSTALSGAPGTLGSATSVIQDCIIAFPADSVISTDCAGAATRASGRIMVGGTRVMRGTLTGDVSAPIIPDSPDAVSFTLNVAMDGFAVRVDGSPHALTVKSGSIAFEAQPLLATSATHGLCSVPVPQVFFSSIRHNGARLHLDTDQGGFDVVVDNSAYRAQVGAGPGGENAMGGLIRAAGADLSLEGLPLDPAYDAAAYRAGWACTADLAQPPRHECGSVGGTLGPGIARLTLRSLGAVATLLQENSTCGFASAAVQNGVQVSGSEGQQGTALFTVQDCAVDLTDDVVSTDCNGIETRASGRVVVSATRTVRGLVMGDGGSAVVPEDAHAVEMTLQARFENFSVAVAGSAHSLTINDGSLSAELSPMLAVSSTLGVCSVAVPRVAFTAVRYQDASVTLSTPQAVFTLPIPSSDIAAVVGRVGNQENAISGVINVYGEDMAVDVDGSALDPEYSAATYEASYACNPELTSPVRHDCPDIRPALAQGSARLGVKTFGTVLKAIEKNTSCGFSSASVKANAVVTGTLGEDGASAVATVQNCALNFPVEQTLETDCAGVALMLKGRVTVSGTMTLRGIRSGNVNTPIVPTSWEPAQFNLTMTFEDFTVRSSDLDKALTIRSGRMSGVVAPRTALDTVTGACSMPTGNVKFTNLRYLDAAVSIQTPQGVLHFNVPNATLQAQAGTRDDVANTLDGTLTLGAETFAIPVDPADTVLIPGYDAATYAAGWTCTPNLRTPQDESECSFMETLGQGAARLLVRTLGELAPAVNEDDNCGFSALDVLMEPSHVTGNAGQQGSMTWNISQCGIQPQDETDCLGRVSERSGGASFDAERVVTGERESILLFIDSIVPNSRDSATLTINRLTYQQYRSAGVRADGTPESHAVTVHSGSISAVVKPVLGENQQSPGTFDIRTPVASVENLTTTGLEATLEAEGMLFKLQITDANLSAFNGHRGAEFNEISGHITLNGHRIEVGGALVPDYNQSLFDDAYECSNNLRGVIPVN